MRTGIFFTVVFFMGFWNKAEANKDSSLRACNAIYEADIRTIRLYQQSSGFPFPMMGLGGSDGLVLEFDQIKSERDFYQYTLIHCDAKWNPTPLSRTQSLDGMGYENIENTQFSSGTLMQYTHYSVVLPSDQVKPKLSGNYLLLVYRNFDEKDIVFSRRMMVVANKGSIQMEVMQSRQVELRSSHQQINFTFSKNADYFIPNAMQDVKTVILRNGDWNDAIAGLKPLFIVGNEIKYNHQIGNQMDGLNQYRFFDIRTFRSSTAGVKQRLNIDNQKHVILVNDKTRQFERYFNWADYNGRVLYDNRDLPTPKGTSFESDYCFVHFAVLSESELPDPVYVFGELSDWRVLESHRMYFNQDKKAYEAVIPLKQGYYNYIYGVLDEKNRRLHFKEFEGNHSETENNYMVLVYHKNPGMGYDELIGYGLKNSTSVK
ncbi:MAG: DUF5103 domain-containing protein [Bacteroidetes bacterium]|nr:DUF5103 domain-containing protein [Bacteroidota bacterium]